MAANRLLIARTGSRWGHRIDQSVSLSNDKLLAVRFPKLCTFARFCSPRFSIEAMQFTDNCMSTLVEKKKKKHAYVYTHTRVRFAPGRHGVNWIFRPASFGVTFHNACIYICGSFRSCGDGITRIEKEDKRLCKIPSEIFIRYARQTSLNFADLVRRDNFFTSSLEIFPIRKLSISIYSRTMLSSVEK